MLHQVKKQQQEEKKNLLEQITTKDKSLTQLERKMNSVAEELDTSRMIAKAAELQVLEFL